MSHTRTRTFLKKFASYSDATAAKIASITQYIEEETARIAPRPISEMEKEGLTTTRQVRVRADGSFDLVSRPLV